MPKQEVVEAEAYVRIVGLQVNNVKRISAVDIRPDQKQNVVIIGGRNAQGKTTILDSIMYALAGKKRIPKDPVRHGAEKGEITIELDNDLIISRVMKPDGSGDIVIKNKAGAKYGSPQRILDSMTGMLTFDPLAFANMDKAKRLETIRQITGLDFTKHDMDRKAVYNQRTDVNREVESIKAQIAGLPAFDPTLEPVDVAALMAELRGMEDKRLAVVTAERHLDHCTTATARLQHRIQELEDELARVRNQYDNAQTDENKAIDDLATAKDHYSVARAEEIQQQIANAETVNAKVRDNTARTTLEDKLEEADTRAACLTANIEKMDADKAAQIAAAKLPVDGLTFTEDDVFYKDVEFDECSGAERLRVSVAMGAAANPELRVLLIRDGSLLDDENMALLHELAEAHDLQVWIERVGDGDEMAVIIEDGMVAK